MALASLGELVATLGLLSGQSSSSEAGAGVFAKAGALALPRLALAPMIGYLAAPSGASGMALAFAAMLVLARAQATAGGRQPPCSPSSPSARRSSSALP